MSRLPLAHSSKAPWKFYPSNRVSAAIFSARASMKAMSEITKDFFRALLTDSGRRLSRRKKRESRSIHNAEALDPHDLGLTIIKGYT